MRTIISFLIVISNPGIRNALYMHYRYLKIQGQDEWRVEKILIRLSYEQKKDAIMEFQNIMKETIVSLNLILNR